MVHRPQTGTFDTTLDGLAGDIIALQTNVGLGQTALANGPSYAAVLG